MRILQSVVKTVSPAVIIETDIGGSRG